MDDLTTTSSLNDQADRYDRDKFVTELLAYVANVERRANDAQAKLDAIVTIVSEVRWAQAGNRLSPEGARLLAMLQDRIDLIVPPMAPVTDDELAAVWGARDAAAFARRQADSEKVQTT